MFLNKSLSIICFIIVVFGLISGFYLSAKEGEVFENIFGGGGHKPNNWGTMVSAPKGFPRGWSCYPENHCG